MTAYEIRRLIYLGIVLILLVIVLWGSPASAQAVSGLKHPVRKKVVFLPQQEQAVYNTGELQFQYPADDWYQEPVYDGGLRAIKLERTSLLLFESYTSDPDLGRTVDSFTKLSRHAKGYASFERTEFATVGKLGIITPEKNGRLKGIRTSYVMQFSDMRNVAFVQYWFQTDKNIVTVLTFVCPAMLKDIYTPAFDRIAITAVIR